QGNTSLHLATQHCETSIKRLWLIDALVDYKGMPSKPQLAHFDPLDQDGSTPLNLFVQNSEPFVRNLLLVIENLLNAGADPTFKNKQQQTSFKYLAAVQEQLATLYPELQDLAQRVSGRMKQSVDEKAARFNKSANIHPDGEVVLLSKMGLFALQPVNPFTPVPNLSPRFGG
ncbi:MAG TPA: hypothetical protein VI522_06605, partial [Gammaproteobacteria bacterium]|nr:hypothetical protein [Gammaproteobacteria bacterium]